MFHGTINKIRQVMLLFRPDFVSGQSKGICDGPSSSGIEFS
jgi:hypothetical protein